MIHQQITLVITVFSVFIYYIVLSSHSGPLGSWPSHADLTPQNPQSLTVWLSNFDLVRSCSSFELGVRSSII